MSPSSRGDSTNSSAAGNSACGPSAGEPPSCDVTHVTASAEFALLVVPSSGGERVATESGDDARPPAKRVAVAVRGGVEAAEAGAAAAAAIACCFAATEAGTA